MSKKESIDSIEIYWTKLVLFSFIVLTILVLFIIAPKSVFDKHSPFRLANSMAMLDSSNFMLYDYKVYSTEERFEKALIDDVKIEVEKFRERNEIVAVMIYGEEEKIVVLEDYILIYSPDAFELNIEYYMVINLKVADVSVPVRTFIMLFKDISRLINNIYRAVLIIMTLSFLVPMIIKLINVILVLKNQIHVIKER